MNASLSPSLPSRPILAGNSKAAIDVLDLMLEVWAPADLLVIAPPHGPSHEWQPSLGDEAVGRGVRVLTPGNVNADEVIEQLRRHHTDLLLSVYYTQDFSAALLGVVDGPALTFHPSLLPRHRGTAPLIWAIAEGDTMTGVSVHELTVAVDTGPLLWQHPLPIHADDTGFSLHLKAAALVRATAADLLRRLRIGHHLPEPVEQAGQVSAHTSRDPQINRIDWGDDASRIRNVVRALAHPLPGAHTTWRGQVIGLESVAYVRQPMTQAAPGFVDIDASGDVVAWAGDGPLRVDAVRLEGQQQPGAALWDLGVGVGDCLG